MKTESRYYIIGFFAELSLDDESDIPAKKEYPVLLKLKKDIDPEVIDLMEKDSETIETASGDFLSYIDSVLINNAPIKFGKHFKWWSWKYPSILRHPTLRFYRGPGRKPFKMLVCESDKSAKLWFELEAET